MAFEPLTNALPGNVQFASVSEFNYNHALPKTTSFGLLVRLQHIFASGEHPTLSLPAKVDLLKLFNTATLGTVISIDELTLSTSGKVSEVHRLAWRTDESGDDIRRGGGESAATSVVNGTVILLPMTTRTLAFQIKRP